MFVILLGACDCSFSAVAAADACFFSSFLFATFGINEDGGVQVST